MPRISVLIPTFNASACLKRGVESILAQTYTDLELVVVNDYGSADGTKELIEAYAKQDDRVRLIQLKKRAGLANSLNIGIRACRGEYIARMDADDYAYPTRLSRQVAFMDSHPDVVICGTAMRIIEPNGNARTVIRLADDDYIKAQLLFACALGHPTVMFRKNSFIKNGWEYDPNAIAEDFDLWTRVDGKMANLSEILLDYYNSDDNRSSKFNLKVHSDSCRIVKEQLERKLEISTKKFPDHLFWLDNWTSGFSFEDYLLGYKLLKEIEQKNLVKRMYADDALAAILCSKWNQYTYYLRHTVKLAGHLPILQSQKGKTFSENLAQALGTSKHEIMSALKRMTSNALPEASEKILTGLSSSPRVGGACQSVQY